MMPTPSRTSLEDIVAAARVLVTAGGPEALTMRAVAEKVGVRAPSLYKRVRDRSALRRLVVDDGLRELGIAMEAAPPGRDAAAYLWALATEYRAFAPAQPKLFGLLFAGAADSA